MNTMIKAAAVLGVAGLMAAATVTPSEARMTRGEAAAAGFAAGAVVGAAATSNRGYYSGPGHYGYYASEPTYYDSYAYEPTYEPAPRAYYGGYNAFESGNGCGRSPGSVRSGTCD